MGFDAGKNVMDTTLARIQEFIPRSMNGKNRSPEKVAADDYKIIRRGVPTHFSRVASFSAIPCVWKQILLLPPFLINTIRQKFKICKCG